MNLPHKSYSLNANVVFLITYFCPNNLNKANTYSCYALLVFIIFINKDNKVPKLVPHKYLQLLQRAQ
ncbi:hypothetical protein BS333_15425 [Vibrio azureus]|nr:hypothetical protein BS333_15425 [Vibrio azureus]